MSPMRLAKANHHQHTKNAKCKNDERHKIKVKLVKLCAKNRIEPNEFVRFRLQHKTRTELNK